ncbi:MAG: alpha/beta hydrolase [Pseudonocardia sp.]|nr:alpha/beta hydrolase [Pseudonocardia sp.]
MTTYVLVPGFWLGAWVWDEVAAELRASGHDVVAVDLLGPTAEAHVDEVLAALDGHSAVVLVGHSGGGPVVAAVAERAREQVSHLVFVDSGPLPDGVAQIDFTPPAAQGWTREQIAANGGRYPMPSRAEFDELGTSTAGLDDETFARLRGRSRPEPAGVVTGPIRRGAPDPSLPRTVVACSFTAADVAGLIGAGVPGFAEMGGPEWSFVELPTGHWPMVSEPGALAAVLARST